MMKRRNFLKMLGLGYGALFVKPSVVPEYTGKIDAVPGKIDDWTIQVTNPNPPFTSEGWTTTNTGGSSMVYVSAYPILTSSSACHQITNWKNGRFMA